MQHRCGVNNSIVFGQLSAGGSTLMTAHHGEKSRRHDMPTHFHGASFNRGGTSHDWCMRLVSIIHRLLLASALLGIIFGPVNGGVTGSAMASSVSTHMTAMDMPEDMRCCPGEKSGCDGVACPLALVCATTFVGSAADEAPVNLVWTAHRFLSVPFQVLASTLVDPPAGPPRV